MKHEVLVYNKTRERIPKKFIESVILRSLNFFLPSGDLPEGEKLKQPVEMAVLVVDKKEIKRLNKIWRKKSYAPEELSFGLNSRQKEIFAKRKNKMLELGEIVISSEKIRDKKYLATLLIHSLLHLLGYDHEKSAAKAKKMERLETKILNHVSQ